MSDKLSKIGSVEKALQILECFTRKDPFLTLDEIANRTGFSRTTTFRMICSLEKFGYIKRKPTAGELQFSLGWAFLEKAQLVNEQIDIKEMAKEEMLQLRNQTGLSIQLAVRDGLDAVYIEQFESLKPFRLYPEIGRRAPLYSAACPRVLLAFLPDREREDLLQKFTYNSFTSHTLTSPERIRAELVKIRENGYAISKGELHEGTIAIAAPIFNFSQRVVASLSIIGLESDFTDMKMDELIGLLKSKADAISQKLRGN
ncbi:IclR family transcriptional regulator [Brevibacillus marinus]|uniref:IclR family transcriptional regulator n=1 Tax=Brevibacillus marinus TaxID=2496837 RepID=UPI000F847BC5|nr:IclR family transcriptional regulator [Brevibacillus marinus]